MKLTAEQIASLDELISAFFDKRRESGKRDGVTAIFADASEVALLEDAIRALEVGDE